MSTKWIFSVFLAGLFFLSCSQDNPLFRNDKASDILLKILISDGDGVSRNSDGLAKLAVITQVTVTVSAPDIETVVEELTVSSDKKSASGSIKVLKGNDRTFSVEAKDANGITQYSGWTTQDILEDEETVSITTEGHYPSPVTLTVGSVALNSVELT